MTRPCVTCGQPVLAGPELRAIRLALGWSQSRMAEELGKFKSQVSKWENDKQQPEEAILERYEHWKEEINA